MLNVVLLEGFVTKRIWRYDSRTHCRMAVYPGEYTGPGKSNKENVVYHTIRFDLPVPLRIEPGMRLRVQGPLGTTIEDLTLRRFIEGLDESQQEVIDGNIPTDALDFSLPREHTVVLAQDVAVLSEASA